MRRLLVLALLPLLGCGSVGKILSQENYFLCTGFDAEASVYTFKHVFNDHGSGYNTIIRASPKGFYFQGKEVMDSYPWMPTGCFPGMRWSAREVEFNEEERGFRLQNRAMDKEQPWVVKSYYKVQFTVLSEVIETPIH